MNDHPNGSDNCYRFGSFPGVRVITGRRPRRISLLMSFFKGVVVVL
nr:MAG TPA: hypothetical protein [Bacteriophage sp.]DAL58131.1 MAG TPA_asm: hypothetical protein [Bacteriophage sp.]